MGSARSIAVAKVLTIGGFLVLLSSTYYLRSEVLDLNRIHFSADETRAQYELRRLEQEYPDRLERYQVELKNHELALQHYEEMLALYKTDYDAYVMRLEDAYQPPQLPMKPQPPVPPEIQKKLAEINTEFRAKKFEYFRLTRLLNWVAWGAAMLLVGGLLYLLMFDLNGQRWFYVFTLVLSFVFLIGPAFHSILSAIIGFMRAPGLM